MLVIALAILIVVTTGLLNAAIWFSLFTAWGRSPRHGAGAFVIQTALLVGAILVSISFKNGFAFGLLMVFVTIVSPSLMLARIAQSELMARGRAPKDSDYVLLPASGMPLVGPLFSVFLIRTFDIVEKQANERP